MKRQSSALKVSLTMWVLCPSPDVFIVVPGTRAPRSAQSAVAHFEHRSESRCYHCFDVTSEFVFPCGHLCMCEECAKDIQDLHVSRKRPILLPCMKDRGQSSQHPVTCVSIAHFQHYRICMYAQPPLCICAVCTTWPKMAISVSYAGI